MEIPNLSPQPPKPLGPKSFSPLVLAAIVPLSVVVGFLFSRLTPLTSKSGSNSFSNGQKPIPIENVKSSQDLAVGKVYGNSEKTFKDVDIGVVEKGSLNGEGTHILNREGGATQRAALTSSVLDLDLFVDRKVEVKGETNISNKTAWLMDVGSIKILE